MFWAWWWKQNEQGHGHCHGHEEDQCSFYYESSSYTGDTLLLIALRYGCPPQVITVVLNAWPGATAVKNRQGHTPLHFAMLYNADTATIRVSLCGEN